MGLKVTGAGVGRRRTDSLREALSAAALALAVLAGCAARVPDSRPTPRSAEAVPQSPPVAASTLTTQPVPVDVAVPASEYPLQALVANAEGSVLLKILIDDTGRVREAKALRDPGYGFGEAAMRSAIAHFRFSPPRLHGSPVATWWLYTVTYVLPRR
jgi:periplasmic protein TonB